MKSQGRQVCFLGSRAVLVRRRLVLTLERKLIFIPQTVSSQGSVTPQLSTPSSEPWKDYSNSMVAPSSPLTTRAFGTLIHVQFQQQSRPATSEANPTFVTGSSLNGFPMADGSLTSHLLADAGHHHMRRNSGMANIGLGSETERLENTSTKPENSAMLPWAGPTGPDMCDSPRHGGEPNLSMHSSPSSGLMELDSGFVTRGTSGISTDQLSLHDPSLSATGYSDTYPTPLSIPSSTACLCDPTCLRIVESFQHAQLRPSDTMLDRALLLLRSGISMCEQSLTCATCIQRSSPLAFILLIQDAMKSYQSLLASQAGNPSANPTVSGVTIGCFEVDDALQSQVVIEVVKAEMQKAISVLRAFEEATQSNKNSTCLQQAITHLSKALREEFSG